MRCQGPNRRELLKFGSLALAGAASGVAPFRLNAKNSDLSSNDPAVIFIWLPGGPAHQDTFDLKPGAPVEYRGEFKPISTNVPGIDICEHMPKIATIADKFVLIRSIAHTFADHGGGHKKFLTGRDPLQPTGFVNDYPMVGSMASKLLGDTPNGLPNYIAGVDGGRQGIDTFSFGSAYLGSPTHPFTFSGDPSESTFTIKNLSPNASLQKNLPERQSLLRSFDTPIARENSGIAEGMDKNRERAYDLILSPSAKKAFDLSSEDSKIRERYGNHRYGQRCLMARRLVEAGVPWVTMVLENASPPGGSFPADGTYNWDSHAVNCHIFNDTKHKLQYFDRAISALIEDLHQRGLNKRVMLVVTGEFGRTPKVETAKNRPGRDHWPRAMSMLVSGGAGTMGQVIGSTTSKAEEPKERRMVPNHLWATVFQHLKIDHKTASFLDGTGRPMPALPDGEVIPELV